MRRTKNPGMKLVCDMQNFLFFLTIENNPARIRKLLEDVLNQRQFAGLKRSQENAMLGKVLKYLQETWIFKEFLKLISKIMESIGGFFASSNPIIYIATGLLFGVVLIFLILSIRRRIAGNMALSSSGEEEKESIDPAVREKQGFNAADMGDFTNAIRHLYKSLLLFFNLKGILEYKISRTNRETEVILKRSVTGEFLGNFSLLNRIFEDKVYALRPCTEFEFHEFKSAYDFCRRGVREI